MNRRELKKATLPRWAIELDRFLPLKSQIYLYGNIYDSYYFPVNCATCENLDDLKYANFNDLTLLLQFYLRDEGYDLICTYDMLDGFTVESRDGSVTGENLLAFLAEGDAHHQERFGAVTSLDRVRDLREALNVFRGLAANGRMFAAGIVNHASRFTSNPRSPDLEERFHFLKLVKAAQEARAFPEKEGRRNVLIFLCEKLNDIPPWVLLENPLAKGIEIQKPSKDERKRFFTSQQERFFREGNAPPVETVRDLFGDLTDGFASRELENIITLSQRERIPAGTIQAAIDLYKYGERENFWEKLEHRKVLAAEVELKKRVMGQDAAVTKTIDIIRRAKLGLNTIDSSKSNRPKGVLFFAGPTGTGKTELAKSLAALIFGDEDAIVRFDMSEYNDANSGVKLIGSPPGYVGYEEGGQLTRQMKAKPFSIVLFDEIEKAHPIIFDKFLQILDDGRLTDGKGETVYFGESLIIFTSNLGVFREVVSEGRASRVQNIDPAKDDYADVRDKIMAEVRNFFSAKLNRPEILNRFGENFVVFDFIRPPVDRLILGKVLGNIGRNLTEQKSCEFHYDEEFITAFLEHYVADNLLFGGRGINNRVEAYIKNGLANFLFSVGRAEGVTCEVLIDASSPDGQGRPSIVFRERARSSGG